MIKFAVTIPCYNEGKNVPILLKKIERFSLETKIFFLIVDNGSTDNSFNNLEINSPYIELLKLKKNKGYGFGILSGLKKIQNYDVIGWTHADLQTDINDLLIAKNNFEHYGEHCFIKGKRKGRRLTDTFFSAGMSVFESILFKNLLWEINAQPTLFPSSFFKLWKNPPYDFSLDLYSFILAKKHNLKICRFPVFFYKRIHGKSSWNVDFKSKYKFIIRTLKFSFQLKRYLE